MVQSILQKLHAWEKSGSQVIAREISYSLIVNISLTDKYQTLIFGF